MKEFEFDGSEIEFPHAAESFIADRHRPSPIIGEALAPMPDCVTIVQPQHFALPDLAEDRERALPAARSAAAPRAEVLRRLPASSQVQVSGADHFFNDREDQLVQSVRRFLDRVIER